MFETSDMVSWFVVRGVRDEVNLSIVFDLREDLEPGARTPMICEVRLCMWWMSSIG